MNITILAGNLGKDPEIRMTPNGKKVAYFSLAVKNGENTEWFNCQAWDRQADYLEKYAHKGDLVMCRGKATQQVFEGKNGRVDRVIFTMYEVTSISKKSESWANNKAQDNMGITPDELPFY